MKQQPNSPRPQKPQVGIPPLCTHHTHDLIVNRLKIRRNNAWKPTLVLAQVLLFQWSLGDRRIYARTQGDVENLSLVLAEIGCLACYDTKAYQRVFLLIRKCGLELAQLIARGKASDPDWPIKDRSPLPKAPPQLLP